MSNARQRWHRVQTGVRRERLGAGHRQAARLGGAAFALSSTRLPVISGSMATIHASLADAMVRLEKATRQQVVQLTV